MGRCRRPRAHFSLLRALLPVALARPQTQHETLAQGRSLAHFHAPRRPFLDDPPGIYAPRVAEPVGFSGGAGPWRLVVLRLCRATEATPASPPGRSKTCGGYRAS